MTVEEISLLYDRYLEDAARAEREQKPGEGLFGFGKRPQDAPCHEHFVSDLGTALNVIAESEPDSTFLRSILGMIYDAPKTRPAPKSAYWMLIAVHGLTLPLIPLLSPEDAAALSLSYAAAFPRRERLPVQKQVLDSLKKAEK